MSADTRKRTLSFSSETPVERWFGNEILDHSPSSVRMDFMSSGNAPLLMHHDMRQQIGVVSSAQLAGKRGDATVRFGRTGQANDALQNVDDGIYRNTSVGYRVRAMKLESTQDDEDTYRITDWEPFEVSIVGVPADSTVGIGRGEPEKPPDKAADTTTESPEARSTRASSSGASKEAASEVHITAQPAEGVTTVTDKTAAAGASADDRKVSAQQAENERIGAIRSLCKANKIAASVERLWIESGTRLEDEIGDNGQVRVKGVASEILDVMEKRGRETPSVAAALGLSTREAARYSLFKAIRALRYGGQNPKLVAEAAYEMECSAAVGKNLGRELTSSILVPSEVLTRPLALPEEKLRAMATQPGAKGGYMVNVQNMGFIDILRNRSVAMSMGARVLSGLQGNVMFPRQTGKVTVTWQAGEGTSVTAADQALGQLSMTPKTCIAITDVSEQLLAQATPSAEAFVMADLAADVAIDGVDYAVINGTGGAQPLGIKNTTGITSGQDAASATYAKILAFVSTAGAANAIRGNPGWVTNTTGAARLMQVQRFTSTDTPLWTGNMLNGNLVGFNAMSSEQLAANNLIFGSWDEVVIGEWGVLELSTDNGGTRFNQAQVGIRAMWMVDVLLRYPQAFVVSVNLS